MNICGRCGEEVYFAEQKLAFGKIWHSFCFTCCKCRKLLDSCSVCPYKSELYCPACYRGISSTPNLHTSYRSKPRHCNPCIPFKPHQIGGKYQNIVPNPICEHICCSTGHLKQNKRNRCVYCNYHQCNCDCCVKGCDLASKSAEIAREQTYCNCQGHLEVPKRCSCSLCINQFEPVLPQFQRLHCLSRQINQGVKCKASQKVQEGDLCPKNFKCHRCRCEGCKYCC